MNLISLRIIDIAQLSSHQVMLIANPVVQLPYTICPELDRFSYVVWKAFHPKQNEKKPSSLDTVEPAIEKPADAKLNSSNLDMSNLTPQK